jgi:hypothetical protein
LHEQWMSGTPVEVPQPRTVSWIIVSIESHTQAAAGN